eukprot:TRINITY_DN55710_c0_g1_i1.p1 TRINITY_DN55710_c0_g1~~TRINITY_DN55710_c0_g1_i1.p1  ORF type:complete len:427 (+),score=47.84 TRINITY_DN55710_c0_g1_i1:65-1282(+)
MSAITVGKCLNGWHGVVKNAIQAELVLNSLSCTRDVLLCSISEVWADSCLKCWWALAQLAQQECGCQNVAEELWEETLRGQQTQRLLRRIQETMEGSTRRVVLETAVSIWRRLARERMVDFATMSAQDIWRKCEQAARAELHQLGACSLRLARHGARCVARVRARRMLRFAIWTWHHVTLSARRNTKIGQWDDPVHSLNAHVSLEETSLERCVAKCLDMRAKQRVLETMTRLLKLWLLAAQNLRFQRATERRLRRAARIAEVRWADRQEAKTRTCLSTWHGIACAARRRWLQRRHDHLSKLVLKLQTKSTHDASGASAARSHNSSVTSPSAPIWSRPPSLPPRIVASEAMRAAELSHLVSGVHIAATSSATTHATSRNTRLRFERADFAARLLRFAGPTSAQREA